MRLGFSVVIAGVIIAATWAWRSGRGVSPLPAPSAVRDVDASDTAMAPYELERFPTLEPETSADVRALIAFCDAATALDTPDLRHAALEASNPLVAGNAVRALGRLGLVEARDAELVALLRDERPRLRQEIIVALGKSGDPAAVVLLVPLLETTGGMLRPLVVQALVRLGGPEARAALEAFAPRASETERALLRELQKP